MQILVTLKDPDGVYESLQELDEYTRKKITTKFFPCEEYCTIVIDTDKMTAKVEE